MTQPNIIFCSTSIPYKLTNINININTIGNNNIITYY